MKKGVVASGVILGLAVGLAPLPLEPRAHALAGVAVWMAVWWMTEAVPLCLTALIPLFAFPMFGILSPKEASSPYGNPYIFLFLGGFAMALAMEESGLHHQISRRVLGMARGKPLGLLLGFLGVSAFLSGWMSNTATTMMLVPVVLAAVPDKSQRYIYLLGVAYGASVGGMLTPIGTPPNAQLLGILSEDAFHKTISFAQWMAMTAPVVVLLLLVVALWLGWSLKRHGSHFTGQIPSATPMNRASWMTLAVFSTAVVAWMTKPWWKSLLPNPAFAHDAGVAMAAAFALFFLPGGEGKPVLKWEQTRRLPWDMTLLFGAGFSLASAFQVTGLSKAISGAISRLGLPHWGFLAVLVLVVVFLTELTSNTATAAVFLPIVGQMAIDVGVDPILFMVPCALAASCAFMLPVATPPNAIIFATGDVPIKRMVRAGLLLNLMSIGVLIIWGLLRH